MKKVILMFAIVATMLSCREANNSSIVSDSTVVDSAKVDSIVIDSVAVDTVIVDSVK